MRCIFIYATSFAEFTELFILVKLARIGVRRQARLKAPQGLKSLREALGLNKTLRAGFGIRGIAIKLSKDEYGALSQDLRGQGGFQNLLHRLQHRINKQTRELELSPQDLERIYRYKVDPKKGGFQGRFKKIFGRHFPDEAVENQNLLGLQPSRSVTCMVEEQSWRRPCCPAA